MTRPDLTFVATINNQRLSKTKSPHPGIATMHHVRFVFSVGFAMVAALAASGVRADPRPTPVVTCTAGGLTTPPKFTQASPGRAEYSFSGVCTARDSGRMLGYRVDATWTPTESNPANANASEVFRVDTLSGPSQSFTVVLGARCDADPWLNAARCTRVGDNVPDELQQLWPGFADSLFPFTRNGISRDQRDALRAEYARNNGGSERSQRVMQGVRTGSGSHAGVSQQIGAADRPADAVSLNPQPLPPKPVDRQQVQPATAGAPSRADQAGIIIVSGKTPYRNATRQKADAVDEKAQQRASDATTSP